MTDYDGTPLLACVYVMNDVTGIDAVQCSCGNGSVMHTKRGSLFLSPLGRENIVSDLGVRIILDAQFCHPLHLLETGELKLM